MDKKKLSDFGRYPTTPFIKLDNVEYKTYYKKAKTERVITESGEEKQLSTPGKMEADFKDGNVYVKVFHNGQVTIKNLTIPGLKVLTFLQVSLGVHSEEICLRPQEIAEWAGYKTLKNVYVGLVELLNKGFIAEQPGGQSYYWINPNIFFNGDRTKLLENPVRAEYAQQLIDENTQRQKDYINSRRD